MKENNISIRQLKEWQTYIEAELGFILPKKQQHWLEKGVAKIARTAAMTPEAMLIKVDSDRQLRQAVFNSILIPESRFFRHMESLIFIGDMAKQSQKQLAINRKKDTNLKKRLVNKRIKYQKLEARQTKLKSTPLKPAKVYQVWSVGCSHGQEAWSLAMILDRRSCSFKIWATDVNTQVLEQARSATYSLRELDNIPKPYHHYANVGDTSWQVSKRLHSSLCFAKHNVFSDDQFIPFQTDVIICQNVLIYFRQFDQRDILARLVAQLVEGGYLVLAPGEALQWRHPQMHRINSKSVNAWQKRSTN